MNYTQPEAEAIDAIKQAEAAMRLGIETINALKERARRLETERDIYACDAEHWRSLAYKLALKRGKKTPRPRASDPS